MTNEEIQSKTIRLLRFPLAVAVVFTHAVSGHEVNAHMSQVDWQNLTGMDIYNIIRYTVSLLIARGARPCFYIFSGFLFFHKMIEWNRPLYFEKIKRRIKTLVIPYLLWNIIPIVITAVLLFRHMDGSLAKWMNELWAGGILKIFWNYYEYGAGNNIFGYPIPSYFPYNDPLWFVRDLIMMSFLSPLIYYYVKYTKIVGIVVLGICYYTQVWIYIPCFKIDAFFFYSLGAFFSIQGKNLIVELRKGMAFWLIVAVITMLIKMYDTESRIVFLFIIALTVTIINIASWLLEHGRINADHAFVSFLSRTSFFVFAVHTVFLLGWSQRFVNFIITSDSVFYLIIKYFSETIVCVVVCVGLYYLTHKIAPKLLNVLTGSR